MKYFITLLLAFTFLPAFSQESDLVLIRIYEGLVNSTSEIVVIEGSEKIRQIDLQAAHKQRDKTGVMIYELLESYFDKGYEIDNAVSGGNQAVLITTYLLRKEDD